MIRAYKDFWKNYFKFSGRTTRASYWWALLWNVIIVSVLGVVAGITAGNKYADIASWDFAGANMVAVTAFVLYNIYLIVTIIPWLSMEYRRFNDAGVPKWLYAAAPFAATIGVVSSYIVTGASVPQWIKWVSYALNFVIFVVSLLPTDDDDEY
ncbi:DUF805 domain-containing protein [Lactobacillaceae bacterium L1_55_11]|nr:DUF805 domain-containing protein [Lactobacillaceae bacterium L1_55_11]